MPAPQRRRVEEEADSSMGGALLLARLLASGGGDIPAQLAPSPPPGRRIADMLMRGAGTP